jgi:hypothetical protein
MKWLLVFSAICVFVAPAAPRVPATVSVNVSGEFVEGHPWYLSVNSAGDAEMTVFHRDKWVRHHFTVSDVQFGELDALLDEVMFFDLADEYGEDVADTSEAVLSVTQGNKHKSVKIKYLMNWVNSDRSKLRDPARVLRVFLLIRSWFSFEDAADVRPFYEQALQAAPSK